MQFLLLLQLWVRPSCVMSVSLLISRGYLQMYSIPCPYSWHYIPLSLWGNERRRDPLPAFLLTFFFLGVCPEDALLSNCCIQWAMQLQFSSINYALDLIKRKYCSNNSLIGGLSKSTACIITDWLAGRTAGKSRLLQYNYITLVVACTNHHSPKLQLPGNRIHQWTAVFCAKMHLSAGVQPSKHHQ